MKRWMIPAAACAALVLAGPGWLGGYGAMIAWTLLLQGTLALSYDILGGYGGELHLGHGAFFGIGAYTAALAANAGAPWWAAACAAGAAGVAAALLFRPFLVPLRGVSFALASLAVLLLCGLFARNLNAWTGGTAGVSISSSFGMDGAYRCTLALFAATLWMHDGMRRSTFGRALLASAADREAAASAGVPTSAIRGKALLWGTVPAALAGGMYPFPMAYVSPQSAFGLEVALTPVVAVLLGGPASRWGPLMGVALYVGLQEWLWTRGWDWSLAVMGGGLMAAGLFLPRGLAGRLSFR